MKEKSVEKAERAKKQARGEIIEKYIKLKLSERKRGLEEIDRVYNGRDNSMISKMNNSQARGGFTNCHMY